MRHVLIVAMTPLVLAGCAGNYHKLAHTKVCEPSRPPSQAATSQLFPSSRLTTPSRNLLGGGRLYNDDGMEWGCIDPASNKMNAPEVPNPHKISVPRLSSAI
jgi:hypothetical protein